MTSGRAYVQPNDNPTLKKSQKEILANIIDTVKVNRYIKVDSSLVLISQGLQISNKANDNLSALRLKYLKSTIFHYKGDLQAVERIIEPCLSQIEDHPNEGELIGNFYLMFGVIKYWKSDLGSALNFFKKANETYTRFGLQKGISNTLVHIGIIHDRIGKLDIAKEYYLKAQSSYQKSNDNIGIAYVLNNLGQIEYKNKEYEKALEYNDMAYHLADSIKYEAMFVRLDINKALILVELNKNEEALQLFKKCVTSYQETNDSLSLATAQVHMERLLSDLYPETNNIEKLKNIINYSDRIADNFIKKNALEVLSKVQFNSKDYKSAYTNLSEANEVNTTMVETKIKESDELQTSKYEYDKLNTLKDRKITSQKYIVTFLMISLLFLSSMLFFIYKARHQTQFAKVNLEERNKELVDTQLLLAQQNKDLEKYIESNIKLQDFAHMTSHDLRSPLITIRGFLKLLKKKTYNKTDDQNKMYIDTIEKGTERLLDLIFDLLEYSKVNSQLLNISIFSLDQLLDEVKFSLRSEMETKNAQIELSSSFQKIKGDKIKLKRVFQNLIGNSLKFVEAKATPQIKVHTSETEASYIINIQDNGIGINHKYIDKIFNPFVQLHSKDKYEGTGLGLSICKSIIEKHNGFFSVTKNDLPGTCFTFSIDKNLN